jgi:uncharacterized membrane protein YhaH (DUF805 family)
MTSALLVLLSQAALGASLALLAASLRLALLADVLATASALGGLAAFVLVAAFTVRRARQLGKEARP